MTTLKICHLYPDVLNLYGDRGNVLCFEKRLEWRGIGCELVERPLGEHSSLADVDLFFIGGGQDLEQKLLLEDLKRGKGANIRAAVEDGKTFLCICGGYQLMGRHYKPADGPRCDFLGAVDMHTVGTRERTVGNFAFETEFGTVVGFENHSGRTYLGEGVEPLGSVLEGFGNNGEDKTEGVRYKNVFGSYSHGPLLPKNPALCDGILRQALLRKYGVAELIELPDISEGEAHESVLRAIVKR